MTPIRVVIKSLSQPKTARGSGGSAVSSPSGVWGGAPAANNFGALWTKMEASGAIILKYYKLCSGSSSLSSWISLMVYFNSAT